MASFQANIRAKKRLLRRSVCFTWIQAMFVVRIVVTSQLNGIYNLRRYWTTRRALSYPQVRRFDPTPGHQPSALFQCRYWNYKEHPGCRKCANSVLIDFFNVLNSRNFGIPSGVASSPGFLNQWATDGGNRRIRLGVRLVF